MGSTGDIVVCVLNGNGSNGLLGTHVEYPMRIRCGVDAVGESHNGYTGKLDSDDVEHIVCGNTNKRMNVSGTGPEGHSRHFPTNWVKESE